MQNPNKLLILRRFTLNLKLHVYHIKRYDNEEKSNFSDFIQCIQIARLCLIIDWTLYNFFYKCGLNMVFYNYSTLMLIVQWIVLSKCQVLFFFSWLISTVRNNQFKPVLDNNAFAVTYLLPPWSAIYIEYFNAVMSITANNCHQLSRKMIITR